MKENISKRIVNNIAQHKQVKKFVEKKKKELP